MLHAIREPRDVHPASVRRPGQLTRGMEPRLADVRAGNGRPGGVPRQRIRGDDQRIRVKDVDAAG